MATLKGLELTETINKSLKSTEDSANGEEVEGLEIYQKIFVKFNFF